MLAALPAVLDACAYSTSQPSTGWAIARWMTRPCAELGGMTPIDVLRSGEIDAVLRATTFSTFSPRHRER